MENDGYVDTGRFSGFAELYAGARPRPPLKVTEIVLAYLRKSGAELTVDLGCGTGLSSRIWLGVSKRIVGIEPTDDMRKVAAATGESIEFIDASSYATTLPTASADIVTCSQSFHWMEPGATLAEVARILTQGGVFAAYDCQWPVQWDWPAEQAHVRFFSRAAALLAAHGLDRDERSFPKDRHCDNVRDSGHFRYVAQAWFDHVEPCDSQRYIEMALSHGQIQALIKHGVADIEAEIATFAAVCNQSLARQMRTSYKMVLGVK